MSALTAVRRDTKCDRLARHPVLATATAPAVRALAAILDEVTLAPGTALLDAGPLARWFFLIEDGDAEAVDATGHARRLGTGDYCGEESLALRASQRVTVTALTEVRAFVAPGRDLVGLIGVAPPVLAPLPRHRPSAAPPRISRPPATAARPQPRRPRASWRRRAVVGAAIAGGLLAAAARYHPPVVMITPGPAIDITNDVTITGVPNHRPHGRYILTTVHLTRPSFLAVTVNRIRDHHDVVPFVRGATGGAAVFDGSRQAAAEAARRDAGLPTPLNATFRHRDVVGPSGGLAYALLIRDMLSDDDWAAGRTIAATGVITGDGTVGLVIGASEKAA
ncbi:MAG TPA: cyclic nucleotide-binding domain-containing protein, partial [Acidimicrobiales bacterium]|nr:cyclic nucleotide-binding domain-containing protein [Acidimicrobiales bacterium]